MEKDIILYGAGDITTYTENPDFVYESVAPLFKADNALVFGQLETVIGEPKEKVPQCRLGCGGDPSLAKCLKRNGFDVVSFAGNHSLDYGYKALVNTLELCRDAGLVYIGAGKNEAAAREIKYIDKDGTRFAFLGYCSILPQDYWCYDDRGGVNPARGVTAYYPKEHDQPGTPVQMFTFPHPEDLKHMQDEIAEAKKNADIVVVSIHWGIHFIKAEIAQYQQYYGHFAIDAGADIILGHHAHTLKPIEIYKGKVIFNSLGNFAMWDRPNPKDILAAHDSIESFENSRSHKTITSLVRPDTVPGRKFDYGHYCHTLCKAIIRDKRIVRVGFIPTFMDFDEKIKIPKPGEEYFEATVNLMKEITEMVGYDTEYKLDGNEIVLVDKS